MGISYAKFATIAAVAVSSFRCKGRKWRYKQLFRRAQLLCLPQVGSNFHAILHASYTATYALPSAKNAALIRRHIAPSASSLAVHVVRRPVYAPSTSALRSRCGQRTFPHPHVPRLPLRVPPCYIRLTHYAIAAFLARETTGHSFLLSHSWHMHLFAFVTPHSYV